MERPASRQTRCSRGLGLIVGGDYDWSWGTGSGQAGSGGTCGPGRDQAVEPDSSSSSSSTPYHPFPLGPSRVARWTLRSSTAHRERDGRARASSEAPDCVAGVSTTPRPDSLQTFPHWTRRARTRVSLLLLSPPAMLRSAVARGSRAVEAGWRTRSECRPSQAARLGTLTPHTLPTDEGYHLVRSPPHQESLPLPSLRSSLVPQAAQDLRLVRLPGRQAPVVYVPLRHVRLMQRASERLTCAK